MVARKSKTQRSDRLPLAQPEAAKSRPETQADQGWRRGVWLPAMLSALALWAAFPPLGWGWLGWLAPLGWLLMCERELPVGRRGYLILWLSGCLFWLLILHGIRLAYWPLIFGWLSLSLYLAVYIPVFVAVTRVMRWRWKWPLVVAAPVVWLGLELIRSYLLTGYAANSLAHTQVHYPRVIQLADQFGGGGVSLIMLTLTAAVLPWCRLLMSVVAGDSRAIAGQSPLSRGSVLWASLLVGGMLGYGWWRIDEADRELSGQLPLLRVLLVQENTPSIFDSYSEERNQQAWQAYLEMTRRGATESAEQAPGEAIDLIVWPESTFTANEPWMETDIARGLPEEVKREQVDEQQLLNVSRQMQSALGYKAQLVIGAVRDGVEANESGGSLRVVGEEEIRESGEDIGSAERSTTLKKPFLLVGNDVFVYRTEKVVRNNAALFIGPDGQLLDRYGKMHLVMFGEYIPLGPALGWLRDLVGLAGMDAGTEVKSFAVGDVNVAPSICFESMMPRVIGWQVRTLSQQGKSPAVLINITNDSWFRGSSMLDHHLACSMLCAVENRRPLLVAANTGLTASIDGCGRLLDCSQRLQAETILAEPKADARWGLVQWLGYPLSWLCAGITLLAMLAGVRRGNAT